VRLRTVLYESGALRVRRLGRPVISVGNLTFGGTGKTPVVEALARALGDEGYRVAVLTRGYGRRGKGRVVLGEGFEAPGASAFERGGDEPALLARRLPKAFVLVDADRYAAGLWAERAIDPDVFVLDDGFQHLRLARDVNLVVVDATNPFGGLEMAPFGTLREPLGAMRRANAVLVSRATRPHDESTLRQTIRGVCGPSTPVIAIDHEVRCFSPLGGGKEVEPEALRDRAVGVLAALGNPSVLLDDLARLGVRVVSTSLLEDHHDYSDRDVESAVAAARAVGAELLVTTGKDAIKLERLARPSLPIYVSEIALRPVDRDLVARLCLDALGPSFRQRPDQI
jgi:tetraacyldisaccharide 4'-kinase